MSVEEPRAPRSEGQPISGWAVGGLALGIWVIWSLTRPGVVRT
jgi:hypothetical protein